MLTQVPAFSRNPEYSGDLHGGHQSGPSGESLACVGILYFTFLNAGRHFRNFLEISL
jgi:hypothetical protein